MTAGTNSYWSVLALSPLWETEILTLQGHRRLSREDETGYFTLYKAGCCPRMASTLTECFYSPQHRPFLYFLIGGVIRKKHLWWHLSLFSSLPATCARLFLNKVVFFYILFIVKLFWTVEHLQVVREAWMLVSFYTKLPAQEGAAGGPASRAWVGQPIKEVASRSSAYPANR